MKGRSPDAGFSLRNKVIIFTELFILFKFIVDDYFIIPHHLLRNHPSLALPPFCDYKLFMSKNITVKESHKLLIRKFLNNLSVSLTHLQLAVALDNSVVVMFA